MNSDEQIIRKMCGYFRKKKMSKTAAGKFLGSKQGAVTEGITAIRFYDRFVKGEVPIKLSLIRLFCKKTGIKPSELLGFDENQ